MCTGAVWSAMVGRFGRSWSSSISMAKGATSRTVPRSALGPPDDGMPFIILTRRVEGKQYSIQKEFRLEVVANEVELPPGPLDWLDWDSERRLIALSGGRI